MSARPAAPSFSCSSSAALRRWSRQGCSISSAAWSTYRTSWSGLWDAAGGELLFMVAVVLILRTLVVAVSALIDQQTITPGFSNLVRWQAHRHVSRQSYTFFQNDFAGRIATKVWQSGQATGDLMESFIEVIWFMIVYTVTTLTLIAGLDWRMALLVLIWIVGFA